MFRPSDLPQPGSGEYLQMLRDRMASFAHCPFRSSRVVPSRSTTSPGRARDIVDRSRLIGHNPWVGDALVDGRFTIAQADVLARAWANPRVRDVSGHTVGAQAIALNEILTKMVDAERLADWEQVRAEHGEAGTALDLPRTRSQRAMDALHSLALQAVESPPGSKAPVPVVNIVIDGHTIREWLDHVAERDPFGVPSLRRRLCHPIDGDPVDPAAVFAALVEGSVRVIGVDAARNPVAISTLQRGFTAAMRDTLLALTPTCVWPGCERRVSTTQTDHMDPWCDGGATASSNGTPLCDHHNRWRHSHRYRVWKDPVGGLHTFRPDGTEVAAA